MYELSDEAFVEGVPRTAKATYSVAEAAELLSLGKTFTWALVRRGELQSSRIGRRVVIPAQAIDQLVERHRVPRSERRIEPDK